MKAHQARDKTIASPTSLLEYAPYRLLRSLFVSQGVHPRERGAVRRYLAAHEGAHSLLNAWQRRTDFRSHPFFELLRAEEQRNWNIDSVKAAWARAERERRRARLGICELSRRVKVSRATISRIRRGENVQMQSLIRLCFPFWFVSGDVRYTRVL